MKTIKVVGAVIQKDDHILIARRLKGEFEGLWEFPGGKIENGELPEQALVREIEEEMEVHIHVDKYLMTAEYDYSTFHLSMACFLCKLMDDKITLNDHSAVQWIPLNIPLESIDWVPADVQVFDFVQKSIK